MEFIASPAGSVADDVCIDAANEHNMTMVLTNFRLFHHWLYNCRKYILAGLELMICLNRVASMTLTATFKLKVIWNHLLGTFIDCIFIRLVKHFPISLLLSLVFLFKIVTLDTNRCFMLRKQCRRIWMSGKCEMILNSSFYQGKIAWYSFGMKMYYVIELFKGNLDCYRELTRSYSK